MNIILLRDVDGKPSRVDLPLRRLLSRAAAGLALVALLAGGLGFLLGDRFGVVAGDAEQRLERLAGSLAGQAQVLSDLRRESDLQLGALAIRLGELQARSLRLEALGQRLTRMGQLEDGEFSFGEPPALGGMSIAGAPLPERVDVPGELARLEERLLRQGRELEVLERLIANRKLDRSLRPAGKPVLSGWLSSRYGTRVDPFTGEPDYHAGMDFSGQPGDPIIAVAHGVVIRAERHPQYGFLVDLDHGNGYVTRYAHNQENLVAVGDRVRAGDVIARMGSTGRATGTHVHFEVFREGRRLDPARVVNTIRG